MKPFRQITLRLPEDLAQQLAERTPSRKRNQFVVDLVRNELSRESRELEAAAMRLSSLEHGHATADDPWLAMDDEEAWGEFDEDRFLRELNTREVSAQGDDGPKSTRLKRRFG